MVNKFGDTKTQKRNFILIASDILFAPLGAVFIDGGTVIPAFIAALVSKDMAPIILGLINTLQKASSCFAPIIIGHRLHGRKLLKSFCVKALLLSKTFAFAFVIVLFTANPTSKIFLIISFFVFYIIYFVVENLMYSSWLDLLAKTIPEHKRGRLLGVTMTIGGVLAIGVGKVVGFILNYKALPFPTNYAYLFLFMAILSSLSIAAFAMLKEPEGEVVEEKPPFWVYIKDTFAYLKIDKDLKRLFTLEILMGAFASCLPFFILYAREVSDISLKQIGFYIMVQSTGRLISSSLAGYINDHYGPKRTIVYTIIMITIAFIIACLMPHLPQFMFALVFFCIGAYWGGMVVGFNSYILELAAPELRKTYVGILNVSNAPVIFFPLLCGQFVKLTSYWTLFMVGLVICIISIYLAVRLRKAANLA